MSIKKSIYTNYKQSFPAYSESYANDSNMSYYEMSTALVSYKYFILIESIDTNKSAIFCLLLHGNGSDK